MEKKKIPPTGNSNYLAAGGRTLLVCSGSAILQEGYYEVFKKYCTKP